MVDRAYIGLWHRHNKDPTPKTAAQFQALLSKERNPAAILNQLSTIVNSNTIH